MAYFPSIPGAEGLGDTSYNVPMKFPAYTDLWFTGTVNSGTGVGAVEYVGYLVTE